MLILLVFLLLKKVLSASSYGHFIATKEFRSQCHIIRFCKNNIVQRVSDQYFKPYIVQNVSDQYFKPYIVQNGTITLRIYGNWHLKAAAQFKRPPPGGRDVRIPKMKGIRGLAPPKLQKILNINSEKITSSKTLHV